MIQGAFLGLHVRYFLKTVLSKGVKSFLHFYSVGYCFV